MKKKQRREIGVALIEFGHCVLTEKIEPKSFTIVNNGISFEDLDRRSMMLDDGSRTMVLNYQDLKIKTIAQQIEEQTKI